MNTTYNHPSFMLGSIVDIKITELLNKLNKEQNTIEIAKDKMNSFIMMKRSIAMTVNELVDMNVDVTSVKNKLKELDISISKSANAYMTTKLKGEKEIQKLCNEISIIKKSEASESPINFVESEILRLPLASESLKFDSQYFSFGSNSEDDKLSAIEAFIREATNNVDEKSNVAAKSVTANIKRQRQNHNLAGTLIITACCTHKIVSVYDPLVLDIDKSISSLNSEYNEILIDIDNPESVKELLNKSDKDSYLSIVSGVEYGSFFIGMVHMVNSESTTSGDVDKILEDLQKQMRIGGWLENSSGGFGIDQNLLSDVKRTLSTQRVSNHVTIISSGVIPSISSNNLKLGVKKIMESKTSDIINTIEIDSNKTVTSEAEEAKKKKRELELYKAKSKTVMETLGSIDQGSNKVFDINTLISAFENYIQSIRNTDKNSSYGVPIRYHIKKITKNYIAREWLKKYYPEFLLKNKNTKGAK